MKLTTERLKKLIREEMQRINEFVTNKWIRRDKVNFNGKQYVYYVFVEGEKGVKNLGNDIKTSGPDNPDAKSKIGHVRVKVNINDPKSLWNAIKDQEEAKHGKFKKPHMFVLGWDETVDLEDLTGEI